MANDVCRHYRDKMDAAFVANARALQKLAVARAAANNAARGSDAYAPYQAAEDAAFLAGVAADDAYREWFLNCSPKPLDTSPNVVYI